MNLKICDLHMHVVPNVDDGATDLAMSLDMLTAAYNQGVRKIYCTSHNGYEKKDVERYNAQFMMLQMMAKSRFPDLELRTGCEILCAGEYVEDVLYALEIGVFLPLGNSDLVLVELYPDVTPKEAKSVVQAFVSAGFKPVLAHTERYPGLFDGDTVEQLTNLGAKIQINLYSLDEEGDEALKNRARYLVENRYAHFVGSDAHRSNHRAPRYDAGVRYLLENCDREYAEKLCFKNVEEYIK